MLGSGVLGFRMLVIVLEFIVPENFLPCVNNDWRWMIKDPANSISDNSNFPDASFQSSSYQGKNTSFVYQQYSRNRTWLRGKGRNVLRKGRKWLTSFAGFSPTRPRSERTLGTRLGNGRENVGCYDNKTSLPVYRIRVEWSRGRHSVMNRLMLY